LNSLLAILKNILELEEWNRINSLSSEPIESDEDRLENSNDDISSEEHFENSNILSRDPAPLKVKVNEAVAYILWINLTTVYLYYV
jgi:hypothetical protein